MTIGSLVLFCSIVFIAAIVQGISGFAFGMVLLMVLPFLFSYSQALALAILMNAIVLIYSAVVYRKHCNWHWLPLGIFCFACGDLAGILVLKRVGDHPIWYALMGCMFILMAVFLLWGQQRVHIKANNKNLVVFSVLGGAVAGAFGAGGPIIATFFLEAARSKEEYLGTIQVLSLFGLSLDVIFRALNGMYTRTLISYAAIGLVFMFVGVYLAKRLVDHMNPLTMRKVVCGTIIFTGIAMFFQS